MQMAAMPPVVSFTSKHINCAIHKLSRYSKVCMAVIDSKPFQRLRELKQLGLTHYVFPTATHSRL